MPTPDGRTHEQLIREALYGARRGAHFGEPSAAVENRVQALCTSLRVSVLDRPQPGDDPAYDRPTRSLPAAVRELRELVEHLDRHRVYGSARVEIGRDAACYLSLAALRAVTAAPSLDAPGPSGVVTPRRGDGIEAWLRAKRDLGVAKGSAEWTVLNQMLDRYQECADTGTPFEPDPTPPPPNCGDPVADYAAAVALPAGTLIELGGVRGLVTLNSDGAPGITWASASPPTAWWPSRIVTLPAPPGATA